jgi:hypothetical protein
LLDATRYGTPSTMTVDELDIAQGGIVSGTLYNNDGTGYLSEIHHFGHVGVVSGSEVVLGAGLTNVYSVTLGAVGDIAYDFNGCSAHTINTSGFESVTKQFAGNITIYGDDNNNVITAGVGGDTVHTGLGYDTLVYTSVADSYGGATSADGHTDLIYDFQDDASTQVDLSQMANFSSMYFGTDHGAQSDVASAFVADAAFEVNVAEIGGNTFIHVAGAGGGYSAGDLLIQLQGTHVVTSSNFNVGPAP